MCVTTGTIVLLCMCTSKSCCFKNDLISDLNLGKVFKKTCDTIITVDFVIHAQIESTG